MTGYERSRKVSNLVNQTSTVTMNKQENQNEEETNLLKVNEFSFKDIELDVIVGYQNDKKHLYITWRCERRIQEGYND